MTQIPVSEDKQKSLLPYDKDYVLISKRTLAVNAGVTAQMIDFLAEQLKTTPEEISALFTVPMVDHIASLSEDKLSDIIQDLIANLWQANHTKLSITVEAKLHEQR